MPFTFYTVPINHNTIHILEYNTGSSIPTNSRIWTVTPGNYNGSDFAAALSTNSYGYTFTYNATTNLIRLTAYPPLPLRLQFAAVDYDLYAILGVIDLSTVYYVSSTPAFTSMGSQIAINLGGPREIYLRIPGFPTKSRPSYGDLSTKNLGCAVPVNTFPGGLIQFEPPVPFQLVQEGWGLEQLQLQWLDKDGEILLLNGGEWYVSLQIIIEPNSIMLRR
jgi:hypothetical protein